MEQRGNEVHLESTEASGGSKEGVVRWVLVIGTLLAIVALSAIWITGAATQGDVEEEATVSGQISSQENDSGNSTDSIVSDEFAGSDAPSGPAGDTPVDPNAIDQSAQAEVRSGSAGEQ